MRLRINSESIHIHSIADKSHVDLVKQYLPYAYSEYKDLSRKIVLNHTDMKTKYEFDILKMECHPEVNIMEVDCSVLQDGESKYVCRARFDWEEFIYEQGAADETKSNKNS